MKEIHGTDKVNGITYIDRETGEEKHIELEGVFYPNRSCSKYGMAR